MGMIISIVSAHATVEHVSYNNLQHKPKIKTNKQTGYW